jgi:putative ABC transport system permease protein
MKISDLFEETYFALLANKARSGLTILGIVIGIGSVIAMIAIGQGSQNTIASNIESLGSNLIVVMPGMQRGVGMQVSQGRGSATTLTLDDSKAIASEISLVKAVSPEVSSRQQVKAKTNNTNTSVVGVVPEYLAVRNVQIDQGSFITNQQIDSMSRVAVLGPSVVDDLFGEEIEASDVIGKTVRFKNMDFKVVGVTKEKGGTGFGSQDDMIFIPLSTAQQFLTGSKNVSNIYVQAANQNSMTDLQSEITTLLLARHNISDPSSADFSTINQADIVSAASSVTKTFTILLGSVAAISLLVGGIGIMNMMLTTVTERTREIGLRKAVGAKRQEISNQFLAEAVMLTLIGGVVGVILGWLIAAGVQKFAKIETSMSMPSVLMAFGVSAAIGIVFGYYPARRAAKMNPITALRYE